MQLGHSTGSTRPRCSSICTCCDTHVCRANERWYAPAASHTRHTPHKQGSAAETMMGSMHTAQLGSGSGSSSDHVTVSSSSSSHP